MDPTKPIEFGVLRVDREDHRVSVAGQEVTLTPLEFKLLVMLHDRRGQVQSRDALLSDVWGISADVTTRSVDTHVKRLRSKLGDVGDYVQTVRGIGYRFASSPEEHGSWPNEHREEEARANFAPARAPIRPPSTAPHTTSLRKCAPR